MPVYYSDCPPLGPNYFMFEIKKKDFLCGNPKRLFFQFFEKVMFWRIIVVTKKKKDRRLIVQILFSDKTKMHMKYFGQHTFLIASNYI